MINARTVTTNDCIDGRGIIITTRRNNKNNHALTEGIYDIRNFKRFRY